MRQSRVIVVAILLASVCLPTSVVTPSSPSQTLETRVKGVTMDPSGHLPIVILETTDTRQAFPIWVGMHEAQAIARALEGLSTPRPLTHTLLQNILGDLHTTVVRITIHTLREHTFYASILLQQETTTHTIDARPSDAIALALGTHAPIFVTTAVLEAARPITFSPAAQPPDLVKKLGMHVQDVDPTLARALQLAHQSGVLVAFVDPGSQAEHVGLQRDDVIIRVNDHDIASMGDFLTAFRDTTGQEVVVQINRRHQPVTLHLRLTAQE